jgi:hypothetical protein
MWGGVAELDFLSQKIQLVRAGSIVLCYSSQPLDYLIGLNLLHANIHGCRLNCSTNACDASNCGAIHATMRNKPRALSALI